MGEGSREREGRRDGLPALVSLHDPSGGEGSSGEGSGTGRDEGTGSFSGEVLTVSPRFPAVVFSRVFFGRQKGRVGRREEGERREEGPGNL